MTGILLPQATSPVVLIPLAEVKQSSRNHPWLSRHSGGSWSTRLYVMSFSDETTKIGLSYAVKQRVAGVSTTRRTLGLPGPKGNVAISIGHINARENERLLHERFAGRRVHGEYFNVVFDEAYEALCSLTFRTEQTAEEAAESARAGRFFHALTHGELPINIVRVVSNEELERAKERQRLKAQKRAERRTPPL